MKERTEKAKKTGTLTLAAMDKKSFSDKLFQDKALVAKVHTVNLKENNLSSLPSGLTHCTKLKRLLLSNNRLESLPAEMKAFTLLEKLDLSYNRIVVLPDVLWSLPMLTVLNASHNRIQTFESKAFIEAKKLEELDLSFNEIKAVPSLKDFQALKEINLSDNPLSELPDDIAQCAELLRVLVNNTKLKTLSLALLAESHVTAIEFAGTPVEATRFDQLNGYEEYAKRRKGRVDKAIQGGAHLNLTT